MSHASRSLTQKRFSTQSRRPPSRTTGKALCIGINYLRTPYELRGCINDAITWSNLLTQKYGYTACTIMTDTTESPDLLPNRKNILKHVEALVTDPSTTRKSITYSGHGSFVRDQNRDEKDGRDEAWISIDLEFIMDDELYTILRKLPKGHSLTVVSDSCHSGTVFDLRYSCDSSGRVTENNRFIALAQQKIYCLSGCQDEQVSFDVVQNQKNQGAMTWAVSQVLQSGSAQTMQDFLRQVQRLLNRAKYAQTVGLSSPSRFTPNHRLDLFL